MSQVPSGYPPQIPSAVPQQQSQRTQQAQVYQQQQQRQQPHPSVQNTGQYQKQPQLYGQPLGQTMIGGTQQTPPHHAPIAGQISAPMMQDGTTNQHLRMQQQLQPTQFHQPPIQQQAIQSPALQQQPVIHQQPVIQQEPITQQQPFQQNVPVGQQPMMQQPLTTASPMIDSSGTTGSALNEPDPPEKQEEQQKQQQEPADRLAASIKNLFGQTFRSNTNGPNLGFTPTAAMARSHEEATEADHPLYQFQVTKLRSWRTGYVRLLSLHRDRFCTFDPDSHEVTNSWQYSALTEWVAIPKEKDCILMQVNTDKLKFKCHNVERSDVLTALLKCKFDCEGAPADEYPIFRTCARQTRHGTRVSISIQVAAHGLLEMQPQSLNIIQTYPFTDICAVSFTGDDTSGIVIHFRTGKSRLFFIQSSRAHGNGRSDLITLMKENYEILGLDLRMRESCSIPKWLDDRKSLGKDLAVVMMWPVSKATRRHDASVVGSHQGWLGGTVNRTLAITSQGHVLETDGGGVVNSRRLQDLHALVRHPHTDKISLEFKDGRQRTYGSPNRDAILVSLLDAATNLVGNRTVHVSDVTSGGYSLKSKKVTSDEPGGIFEPISIPAHCLKRVNAVSTAAYAFLCQTRSQSKEEGRAKSVVEECTNVVQACREFNASVPPTGDGLPKVPNDRSILGSLGALWGVIAFLLHKGEGSKNARDWHQAELSAAPMLQAIYRLCHSPAGYKGSVELTSMQSCIPMLTMMEDDFSKFWAFRVLGLLLSSPQGKRDMEIEFVNKSLILQCGGKEFMDELVDTMIEAGTKKVDGKQSVSDLILMVTSDILQSILCSNHDTTSPEYFSVLIQVLATSYRALLSSLRSPTPFVIENSALLLHLLSSHAPETAASIRDAALSSGILLQHFHAAIFSPLGGQRFLSRYLCDLWLSGPKDCDEKRLLRRIVPSGFIGYLNMPVLSRVEEEQLDELEKDGIEAGPSNAARTTQNSDQDDNTEGSALQSTSNDIEVPTGAAGTNTSRLRERIAIATTKVSTLTDQHEPENFRIFFHVLTKDHALPDLIWNQQTRRELRIALENEIQSIKRETEARGGLDNIAWNHQQFKVAYPSLDDQVKVGNIYMRLWLQAGDGFIKSWDEPERLFEQLFRRLLSEIDRNSAVAIMCIRCIERLYLFHAKTIGPFPEIMILVRSMASAPSIEIQHRMLRLIGTLLGVSDDEEAEVINIPDNAEQLLNEESIGHLCHLVAWGHTNGVQVGNLLSTVLKIDQNTALMLTDGTSSGPGGKASAESKERETKAPDSSCPAVWFIASSGRIPPPIEKIKGPYRLSELRSMMDNGDIRRYDLVTASQVEDYTHDDEEGTDAVKETQIDTGKWRKLDQVWQLRWQLCSAQGISGVYGPGGVALIALKSLSRLVDLHKSLDSRGVPYFPVPIAKRLLCGLSREHTQAKAVAQQRENYLSILSQSLLCNDHRVIEASATLLLKLMQHNDGAVAKFYLTGIFFFALAYTGSNFTQLAKLLYNTHLKQHFRSGFAAAADESEISMRERSVLGNMLPQGLLFVLVNYGFEKFTEIFVGNFDTPEVIWNFEMRKHLVEMIRQHLGDFPQRLWQNTTSEYDFCPIPGIAYKRLEKEMFCHNYYLDNLCDEVRFPDWPIAEPVEVFRSCLEEWKRQMNRDESKEEDAQEEARKVLSLKTGDGSKELRRAYRSLARKFHPDKNPAGRDMFERIQKAYELLLPIVESGVKIQALDDDDEEEDGDENESNEAEGLGGGLAQMRSVHLLLRTQLLVCRRHPDEMGKYKYPVYEILLDCLKLPPSCKGLTDFETVPPLLKAKRADFTKTAVSLVFETCAVSPLNAEELVSSGGIPILSSLLGFLISSLPYLVKKRGSDVVQLSVVVEIITELSRTISGVAFFSNGRDAILSLQDLSRFCLDWRKCAEGAFNDAPLSGDSTVSLVRYALEGIAHMAKSSKLQALLIGCGIALPLLRYTMGYDPTLEQLETAVDDRDDLQLSQAACNLHARLSARALGMLCGVLQDEALQSPSNDDLYAAMEKLLTPQLARMLRNKRTSELLKTLNSNIETPTRIWNVSMRNELMNFLHQYRDRRQSDLCRPVEEELSDFGGDFGYATLKNEVVIGGVYIRVFNGMGGDKATVHEIPDLSVFTKQILNFLSRCLNKSRNESVDWEPLPEFAGDAVRESEYLVCDVEEKRFEMALVALKALVHVDGLVGDVFCEPGSHVPSILLSLLELPQESEGFTIGCDILAFMSPKQAFADSVADQRSIWRLLQVLERPEDSEDGSSDIPDQTSKFLRQQKGWSLLESLSSSPSVAKQLVQTYGWMELLGIIAGYAKFTKTWAARQGAAKTLSRLLWDPQTSSIAVPLIQMFLPYALAVVLKEEGADSMLKVFDGESETPELIWDAEMRAELRLALASKLDEGLGGSVEKRSGDFNLPHGYRVRYKKLEDELYIGGVYVRLFLKEPTYNLRDPTTFLEKLLHRWTHELNLYTEGKQSPPESVRAKEGALINAQQDKLDLVTSASVYLCKVKGSLCDKLAEWGYMARSLSAMDEILRQELVGAPLLSVVRLLHVASNRLANVEMLSVVGEASGQGSLVDNAIKAIGRSELHRDCAFMIEMLKKVFKIAIGDLDAVKESKPDPVIQPRRDSHQASEQPLGFDQYGQSQSVSGQNSHQSWRTAQQFNVMAPSPAPGDEPVRRAMEHPLEHPLAFGMDSPAPLPRSSRQASTLPAAQRNTPSAGLPSMQRNTFGSPYTIQGQAPSNYAPPQQPFVQASSQSFSQRSAMLQQRDSISVGQGQSPVAQVGYNIPEGPTFPQTQRQPTQSVHGLPMPFLSAHQSHQESQFAQMPSGQTGSFSSHSQQLHSTQSTFTRSSSQFQESVQSPVSLEHRIGAPMTATFSGDQPSTAHRPTTMQRGQHQHQHQYQHQLQRTPLSFASRSQARFSQQATLQPVASGYGNVPSTQFSSHPQIGHPSNAPVGSQQTGVNQGTRLEQQSYGMSGGMHSRHGSPANPIPQSTQPRTQSQPLQPYNMQNPTPQIVPQTQGRIALAVNQGQQQLLQLQQQQERVAPLTQQRLTGEHLRPVQPAQPVVQPSMQQPMHSTSSPQVYQPSPTVLFAPHAQNQQAQQQQSIAQQPQVPVVETVETEPVQQERPTPVTGTGIDARTGEDPKVLAEQQSVSTGGAPGSAQGRVALLQSALNCRLPEFLLEDVLESPSLAKVKDPASVKVHAVELLKVFTRDPGYGMKFKLILEEIPAWKKYKSQDHSLFITGTEQKTDYFLTDGSNGETTRLLTQGSAN